MRAALGGGEAVIASAIKVATVGATPDRSPGHKDDFWWFDGMETMRFRAPDEIMVTIGSSGGRHAVPRIGKSPMV